MSLNLDDPLAGILSDGSDDSFFDDDIIGKKKPPKKKTTPIATKKSSLFDFEDSDKLKPSANISESKKDALFDLGGDIRNTDEFKTSKAVSPAPIKRSLSKESFKIPAVESKPKPVKSPANTRNSASTDKLDILSEIGSEKKDFMKPLEKGKSSQSILDDILGGSSTKTGGPSQAARPATAAKSQEFDFDSFLGKSDSKPAKNAPGPKSNPKADPPKDDKKPKENPKKKSTDDWLGIFQENDEPKEDTSMPSWLAGDAKKKKEEKPKEIKEIPREAEREREVPQEKEKEKDIQVDSRPITEQIFPKLAPSSVFHGSTEDITAEGATLYLQQQESQLMVAMQLKAQEERLAAMQSKLLFKTS